MADEPDDDFDLDDIDDDFSLPDFDEEIRKAAAETDTEEETVKEVPPPKEPVKATPPPLAAAAPLQTAPAPIGGSREDLDIALNIELGRVSLPMSKLMELEAGSVMDLGISAEQGVDLVVGGRCIGRGELVKIGPKIAVRILSIQ